MRAIVVVGMGCGDEGKGSIVDFFVREYNASTVVLCNGGAQAQHRVVTSNGHSHVFSQFGSGTFVPGVQTFMSRYRMLNPLTLMTEANALRKVTPDPIKRLVIDARAPVTTPFHVAANRLRARAGNNGTTGMGIGETAQDVIAEQELRAGTLNSSFLAYQLRVIQNRKRHECIDLGSEANRTGGEAKADWYTLTDPHRIDDFARMYRYIARHLNIVNDYELNGDVVVFEGSQGALLDQTYGFAPYTTWSNTTADNALELCREHGYDAQRIGVIRAYATRHGAGPLVTEASLDLPEPEVDEDWAGSFRVGHTDLLMARYASECSPVDSLAVTCLDRLTNNMAGFKNWHVCSQYLWPGKGYIKSFNPWGSSYLADVLKSCEPILDPVDPWTIPDLLAETMGVPLHIISEGPAHFHKRELVS